MDDITRILSRIAAIESEIAAEPDVPHWTAIGGHDRLGNARAGRQQYERREHGAPITDVLRIAEDDAERQRLTRMLHKMELAGKVELWRPGGRRATHVCLAGATQPRTCDDVGASN